MTIKKDPKLRAVQDILDNIHLIRLRAERNRAKLIELQAKCSLLSEHNNMDIAYQQALVEKDFRSLQDQNDKIILSSFDISWPYLSELNRRILLTFHQEDRARKDAVPLLCKELKCSQSTIWRKYRLALTNFANLMNL